MLVRLPTSPCSETPSRDQGRDPSLVVPGLSAVPTRDVGDPSRPGVFRPVPPVHFPNCLTYLQRPSWTHRVSRPSLSVHSPSGTQSLLPSTPATVVDEYVCVNPPVLSIPLGNFHLTFRRVSRTDQGDYLGNFPLFTVCLRVTTEHRHRLPVSAKPG